MSRYLGTSIDRYPQSHHRLTRGKFNVCPGRGQNPVPISIHQRSKGRLPHPNTSLRVRRVLQLILSECFYDRTENWGGKSNRTFHLFSFFYRWIIHSMVISVAIALLGSLSYFPTSTWGFGPNHHRILSRRVVSTAGRVHFPINPSNNNNNNIIIVETTVAASATALFENKLWDRMEIEQDEEPMWYVLNCVAGLELDLLRQCRQRCEGMKDVEKFVVPMVTTTRSHGANRMVRDTKVKYQCYVFAKLRLCPETYEAIQGKLREKWSELYLAWDPVVATNLVVHILYLFTPTSSL